MATVPFSTSGSVSFVRLQGDDEVSVRIERDDPIDFLTNPFGFWQISFDPSEALTAQELADYLDLCEKLWTHAKNTLGV